GRRWPSGRQFDRGLHQPSCPSSMSLADPAIVSDSNATRRRQTKVSRETPMSMHPVGRREFLMTMAAAGAAGFVRVETAYDPTASFEVAVSEVEFRRNASG